MTIKSYPIIGTKSSILWDEKTGAWDYLSGEPKRQDDPSEYYKIIPTLYRAVDLRAKAIAGLPWALMKGETEFETSDNYENKLGLVSNMNTMLLLIEMSLTLQGAAYWKREKNAAGFDKLRHLDPRSMNLDEEKAVKGEIVWKRSANGVTVELTPEEVIYFWYPDSSVEIGPPSAYPGSNAMAASKTIANLDAFTAAYFGRGAVKAMLFAMSGTGEIEAKKFETWWNKFISGIGNAFRTKVINAEKVEPVVVGEGIKELENVTLTQDMREDIAIATDIPFSILFAGAANYATAERDKLNFYEDFVVPEAKWIASILNEQLFEPLGYKFVFKPETLDIFQEDETERAQAMSFFMDVISKATSLEIALATFDIYGVEISDQAMTWIEQHFAKKDEQAAQMQQQLEQRSPAQGPQRPQEDDEEDEDEPPSMRKVDNQQLQRELSIWQKKCLSALKRGESASSVSFVPVQIPGEAYERITAGLAIAEDEMAVKDVFASALREHEPTVQAETALTFDPWQMIAHELKRANDLLEVSAVTA